MQNCAQPPPMLPLLPSNSCMPLVIENPCSVRVRRPAACEVCLPGGATSRGDGRRGWRPGGGRDRTGNKRPSSSAKLALALSALMAIGLISSCCATPSAHE